MSTWGARTELFEYLRYCHGRSLCPSMSGYAFCTALARSRFVARPAVEKGEGTAGAGAVSGIKPAKASPTYAAERSTAIDTSTADTSVLLERIEERAGEWHA